MKAKHLVILSISLIGNLALAQEQTTNPNDTVKLYDTPSPQEEAITTKQLPPIYSDTPKTTTAPNTSQTNR